MNSAMRRLPWVLLGFLLGVLVAAEPLRHVLSGDPAPSAPKAGAKTTGAPARPAGKRPNIVFMMADNLGYGEPGCYGGGILRGAATPRIDGLARQGTRLLNYSVES